MNEKYPVWIDEFAQSIHQAFAGMVPSRWSSIDGLTIYATWQGSFLSRIHELAEAHITRGTGVKELWDGFPHPSALRNAVWALVYEYSKIRDKEPYRAKARVVFDWLDQILSSGMIEDKWSLNSNKVHSSEKVVSILSNTPWILNNTDAARDSGKLYVSAASIGFALYRDFFPQEAHEVFGPYNASSRFGEDTTLLIKYFPKIRPVELWKETQNFPYEEIKIYQVLKGVHFRCEFIGMHSLYDGPIVPNTIAIAAEVDGKFLGKDEIKKVADSIAQYATDYSHLYEKLNLEQAKWKFAEWEAYQFVKLFQLADIDWRPTDAMVGPILKADNIHMGFQLDSFPTYKEFVSSKQDEIYPLRELYQK